MAIVSRKAVLPRRHQAKRRGNAWPPAPVLVFLVGLILPWSVELGPLGMTVPRLVLLLTLVPCLIKWSRGDAGSTNLVDWLLLAFCFWVCVSLAVVEGPEVAVESGGMIVIETAGSYFLARCYVRTADDFLAVVKVLFLCVIVLLPLAVVEALTGQNLALAFFGTILPTVASSYDGLRWGLKRVQSVYEHPILFGVCTGAVLALAYLVLGHGLPTWQKILAAVLVCATAFLSMSSGAYAVMAVQIGLIAWASITARIPHNWMLLGGVVLAAILTIEIGSNQSVPQFYISRFSLDQETATLRLLIWEFGMASVLSHPLYGIGFASYVRPSWMTDSIDMYWMAIPIRHGIPAGLLMLALPFATLFKVAGARQSDERSGVYRMAYLIVITSFFLAGWSVHFWGTAYLIFMFLFGAGGFLASGAALAPDRNRIRGGVAIAALKRRVAV